jgi:hypothetical protein
MDPTELIFIAVLSLLVGTLLLWLWLSWLSQAIS